MNGSALRRLRLDAHLSQSALAERAGISKRSIAAYESEEAQPSVSAAMRLADALCVSLDELVGRDHAGAPV